MLKVSKITYNRKKKKTYGQVPWQELIRWSPKRANKNALILDTLGIAHSKKKNQSLEDYLKFFNC